MQASAANYSVLSGDTVVNEQKQEKTLSRIGRKPIPLPNGVEVEVLYDGVKVTGPRGIIEQKYHPEVIVKVEEWRMFWWSDSQPINFTIHCTASPQQPDRQCRNRCI